MSILTKNPVMEFYKNITVKVDTPVNGYIKFDIANTEWVMDGRRTRYIDADHKVTIYRGYDVENPVRILEVYKHIYFQPTAHHIHTRFDAVIYVYTWDRDIKKKNQKMLNTK